jgi:DNA topoisomerase I
MGRGRGWTRRGSRGRYRYFDAAGRRITDEAKLARIEALVIPPAWRDVHIAPTARARVQATGIDSAGRKQYIYSEAFRLERDQAKFDRLTLFAERLPGLRQAMSEHIDRDELDRERVSALALRLIDLGWFRVGGERYARENKTFGITTLRKRHVRVRGKRVCLDFPGKTGARIRSVVVDPELAEAVRGLLALRGGPALFRYRWNGELYNLTAKRLNDYVRIYLGEEFTAKDFRTWGGTLLAALAFAERGPVDSEAGTKRVIAAVMRQVGDRLGNTPSVARSSYVSPAVIEQYLDGTTIEDFRPRHLRVVGARDIGLAAEERALLSLLRSWRIKRRLLAA